MTNENYLAKIAVGKSLLKEYSNSCGERIVYMDNDTEFQIQIFNPYTYTIGVAFGFNDDCTNTGRKLIIRPGERIWLDRYLDNESRLLFSTYEVESDNEVKKAIKDNGNLCIQFFSEVKRRTNNLIHTNDSWWPISSFNTVHDNPYMGTWTNTDLLTSNVECNYVETYGAALTATYGADLGSDGANVKVGTNSRLKSQSIETGRIEEGRHSNQKLQNVQQELWSFPFKTEYIKILPMSQKQINANDLAKKYCHECGRKLNQKFKYCPYCGAKL